MTAAGNIERIERSEVLRAIYGNRGFAWGYILLTARGIGWKPRILGLPISLFGDCEVIPLNEIESIHFEPSLWFGMRRMVLSLKQVDSHPMRTEFRVHSQSIPSAIATMQRLRICLANGNQFDPRSSIGFWNSYAFILWLIVVWCLYVAAMALVAIRRDMGFVPVYLLTFAILIAHLCYFLVRYFRRE